MLLRGEQHRAAIRVVLDTFGEDARHFVFVGGCVLGLYVRARPQGAPLRVTKDVDCISTRVPWSHQSKALADLCARGVLSPSHELACRYRINGTDVDVDVLSPEGFNVGGVNPFFQRAAEHARAYAVDDTRTVNAVTPAYFFATKLAAFESRGPNALESKDLEDIVALLVEVGDDVRAEIVAHGIGAELAELWTAALRKYGVQIADLPDVVDAHLARQDVGHRGRVLAALWASLPNGTTYYACVHGERGGQSFEASRTSPEASRLAFTFQAPAFETSQALDDYFVQTFFPLRVVFDDERGIPHVSGDELVDYRDARALMSSVAGRRFTTLYDKEIGADRLAPVRRVRLLTKDGRMLEERDGAASSVATCVWRNGEIAIDGQPVSPSVAQAIFECWVQTVEPETFEDLRWLRWLRDALPSVVHDQPALRTRWFAAATRLAEREERFRTPDSGARFFEQHPSLERWGDPQDE